MFVDDVIYRQAAIDSVSEACFELRGVFGRCEEALKALPAAEPERKKGKWIIYAISLLDGEDVKCSECGQCGCAPNWNFCPNCGAEMTEVENG